MQSQNSEDAQDEAAILKNIIESVNELIMETRGQVKNVRELKQTIEKEHNEGTMTEFSFVINMEHAARAKQNVDYMLRSLDRQKKIALSKLKELGENR